MRKLAWAALSFSAAIFLAHYVIPGECRFGLIAILAVVAMVGTVAARGKVRLGILLVCIFGILGLFRYDIQVHSKLDSVSELYGTTAEISGIVTEYPSNYDTYSRITVRLTTQEIPDCKAVFYVYDGDVDFAPGDMIRGEVKFSSATESAGDETDTYISKGVYLRGYLKSEISVEGRWWASWLYAPAYLARWIQNTIDAYVPERAAVFLKALLTGDKTALYDQPQLYNALSKGGIAHVVAVSGMHVSFLIGLILMLTGNRRGWIFSIAAVILFSVMTGLSPSVLRALFMQVLFLLAPVLRRESDGITSIAFALFVLLLINPFAVASVSLQLSFASMAGIILLTPKLMTWFKAKGKQLSKRKQSAYRFVTVSLATSLGATAFTAPLCAYYFGYVTLLAPLTNLLVLWIVPYCFGGGFLVCIAACVSNTAAEFLGLLLSWMVEFIYWIAGMIAATPLAAAYLPAALLAVWFVFVYLMITASYLRKGEGAYRPLLPVCIAAVSLFVMLIGVMQYYRSGTTVAAVDVGQGQSIVMLDGDSTLMVDCGGAYDAGQAAADWLYTHGRHNVDLLILTHFDTDHVNGVVDLMIRIPVTQIVCCDLNLTEDESNILADIASQAEKSGTEMTYIRESVQYSLGDMSVTAYMLGKNSKNDGIIVLAQRGDFDLLVTGDADQETELELLMADALPDGECIVVGHHGSKSSTGEPILDGFAPDYAFISSGYNSYGHPTQEVLDRLEARNVVIYRTDQLGSIEIKVR